MFCNKCGFELKGNEKFCSRCGAPTSFSALPIQNTSAISNTINLKKKNKVTIFFIAVSVILAVALVLQNFGVIGLITNCGRNSSSLKQMEGNGYDSPEKAVEAYINALQQGDVSAMLSTFAIETYADNIDTYQRLSGLTAWSYYYSKDGSFEITDSDYGRELQYFLRQSDIAQKCYSQYLYCSSFYQEEFDSSLLNSTIYFKDEREIEEFLDAYHENAEIMSEIELIEFIEPKDLEEDYDEILQKYQKHWKKAYGWDDYQCVAACVNINGEKWLLTMDCACYNGHWYNLSLTSFLNSILGMDIRCSGMIPYSMVD